MPYLYKILLKLNPIGKVSDLKEYSEEIIKAMYAIFKINSLTYEGKNVVINFYCVCSDELTDPQKAHQYLIKDKATILSLEPELILKKKRINILEELARKFNKDND